MTVGLLYEGRLTAEQERVQSWLEGSSRSVTTIDLSADGGPDLSSADVLWWQRTHPLTEAAPTASDPARSALVDYVEGGGGLLLTQQAFGAAHQLGFEDQPPDTEGIVVDDGPSGFTARNLYSDHPVFSGLDETFATKPVDRDHHDAPLYWGLNTPQQGTVVGYSAGAPASDDSLQERPGERPLVTWYPGDGAVLGIARNVLFGEVSGQSTPESNLHALVSNALDFLRDGGSARLPGEVRPRGPEESTELRRRLADNDYRPRYHFAPPAGWSNDPCGLLEWNGEFHLFYQHNPYLDGFGTIHWGHATSDNLLDWEDRGIGLAPAPGEPANHGVWTGAAFEQDGTAKFIYTAMGWDTHIVNNGDDYRQRPCLATSPAAPDENLREIQRYDDNPLFQTPPMGFYGYENQPADLEFSLGPGEFRDHHLWTGEDGNIYQLISTGLNTAENPDGTTTEVGGGAGLIYRSTGDLTEWEYVDYVSVTPDSDFLSLPSGRTKPVLWEVAQLLQFETRSMIHWSYGASGGEVGFHWGQWDLDSTTFNSERDGRIAMGDYYAPQAFEADDGRTLMFGWVLPSPGIDYDDGWADTAVTVPHRLYEGEDPANPDGPNYLRIAPAEELTAARKRSYIDVDVSGTDLGAENAQNVLGGLADQSVEVDITIDPEPGTTTRLTVCRAPDGTGGLPIEFEATSEDFGTLRIDRSNYDSRAAYPESDGVVLEQGVALNPDGTLDLRVFVDRSIVEVFANELEYFVSRLYPPTTDHDGYGLTAEGGSVTLQRADAYQLGSIWEHFERRDALVSALLDGDESLTAEHVRTARELLNADETVGETLMKVEYDDLRSLAREVDR